MVDAFCGLELGELAVRIVKADNKADATGALLADGNAMTGEMGVDLVPVWRRRRPELKEGTPETLSLWETCSAQGARLMPFSWPTTSPNRSSPSEVSRPMNRSANEYICKI